MDCDSAFRVGGPTVVCWNATENFRRHEGSNLCQDCSFLGPLYQSQALSWRDLVAGIPILSLHTTSTTTITLIQFGSLISISVRQGIRLLSSFQNTGQILSFVTRLSLLLRGLRMRCIGHREVSCRSTQGYFQRLLLEILNLFHTL